MKEAPGRKADDLQGAQACSPGVPGQLTQVATATPERRLAEAMTVADREQALRAEKVRRVKAQLAQGTYRVDVHAVAQAIVRREVVHLLSGEKKPKG